jgi:hypothetical protein
MTAISTQEALSRLDVVPDYDPGGDGGPGPCVHTFLGVAGAHWRLDDLRALIDRYGVAESGEVARSMGHGLVVIADTLPAPLFLATRPTDDRS